MPGGETWMREGREGWSLAIPGVMVTLMSAPSPCLSSFDPAAEPGSNRREDERGREGKDK